VEALAAALALGSAVLHASWNALIKVREDRLTGMAFIAVVCGVCGAPFIAFAPPMAAAAVPYMAATVMVHNFYYWFLLESYRVSDLSHAYPLARGSAPMIVAVAAPFALGENLSPAEFAGVAVISLGIVVLVQGVGSLFAEWRRIVFPLATGATIATYTSLDALGVRASDSPFAYVGWLFLLDAVPLPLYALLRRPIAAMQTTRRNWRILSLAGFIAFLGYGMVIVALSFGSAAHVVALRETSVILGALIGTRLLREPFGPRRVFAAALVACGAALLEASG
jgi:drug/metabolite transporter (DMT)-like permease